MSRILASFCVAAFVLCAAHAADFEIRQDAEFRRIVPADAKLEKLASGFKFLEGPTWIGKTDGFLVFSDIPANQIRKWTRRDGVTIFREPSNGTNGNTTDLQGRLVCAEHTSRRITVTEADSTIKVVTDRSVDGKRYNSPNDVVVRADGTIWFTDPPYGLPKDQPREQTANHVFRYDPKTGQAKPVASDFNMPNGLAFSPDQRKLYVADSGQPRHIRVFDVNDDGTLSDGRVFCRIDKGGPDGIRVDAEGRVWSSAGDGVHIYAPDGQLIGKILVPESPANLCFGEDGRTLFITARTGLYSIRVNATGIGFGK